MSKILFTGGGSAGHVTPNLALMESMRSRGWKILYMGSEAGIERELVQGTDVLYLSIKTGKLRRYFSWQNFIDPFFVLWGFLQSIYLCLKHRPAVVFSKGGFVSVPVVLAAWICRIPVIAHESDVSPGLATRICLPFCHQLCVNFEQSLAYIPGAVVTGSPVRREILTGDRERGLSHFGLNGEVPVLLVFGGSLGARSINKAVRDALPGLLETFQIMHVCGAGNMDQDIGAKEGRYLQVEYVGQAFGDLLACADMVVSRAGANSIYELLLTRTPHLLIPLSLKASRGDQLLNARTFSREGYSHLLEEEALDGESLLASVREVWADRELLKSRLNAYPLRDSVSEISRIIEETAA